MKKAMLGFDGPLVTPSEFLARAGHDYKIKKLFPICPACRQVVSIYGVHSTTVQERFDHPNFPPDVDPLDDCILAHRQDSRFLGLEPSSWDKTHGQKLRNDFMQSSNIRLTYAFMHALCGPKKLPLQTFVQCIQRADRKNIWSYSGIPLWVIPYILLTFYTFPLVDAKNSFYFSLQKSTQRSASELWITPYRCMLVKRFSDSGNIYKTKYDPFKLSKIRMETIAQENSLWIKEEFIQQIIDEIKI